MTLPPCREDYISSADLKIGHICTNEEYEFEVEFQKFLDECDITYELISPYTPQYNGMTKRALGLAREKVISMSQGIIAASSDRPLTDACGMLNMCVTTLLEDGIPPYETWSFPIVSTAVWYHWMRTEGNKSTQTWPKRRAMRHVRNHPQLHARCSKGARCDHGSDC